MDYTIGPNYDKIIFPTGPYRLTLGVCWMDGIKFVQRKTSDLNAHGKHCVRQLFVLLIEFDTLVIKIPSSESVSLMYVT